MVSWKVTHGHQAIAERIIRFPFKHFKFDTGACSKRFLLVVASPRCCVLYVREWVISIAFSLSVFGLFIDLSCAERTLKLRNRILCHNALRITSDQCSSHGSYGDGRGQELELLVHWLFSLIIRNECEGQKKVREGRGS